MKNQIKKLTAVRIIQIAFLLSLLLVGLKFFLTDPAGIELLENILP